MDLSEAQTRVQLIDRRLALSSGRFWLFVGGFVTLNCLFFILNAIRIAGENEHIYVQAGVFAQRADPGMTGKKLEKLALEARVSSLGPLARAECVRQLMFRNFTIGRLPAALESIEKMSVITGLPPGDIAAYMVILYPLVNATGVEFSRLDDRFFLALRDSAATPEKFFEAFRLTRNLVLSGTMDLDTYLDKLSELLSVGHAPEDIRRHMKEAL